MSAATQNSFPSHAEWLTLSHRCFVVVVVVSFLHRAATNYYQKPVDGVVGFVRDDIDIASKVLAVILSQSNELNRLKCPNGHGIQRKKKDLMKC